MDHKPIMPAVHQLTVREAADLMDVLREGWKVHAIDVLMDGQTELPSPLIFAATHLTYDTFPLDLAPDDLPALYEEVAKHNPFLAATIKGRMAKEVAALETMGEELLQKMQQLNEAVTPSEEQPAN